MNINKRVYTHRLPIAFTDSDIEALEQVAAELETNRSAIARLAIKKFLKEHQESRYQLTRLA